MRYREDGEGRGGVPGDAEAIGLDEEVVLAALGECGVPVPHGGPLRPAAAAELSADEGGEGEQRRPRRHRRARIPREGLSGGGGGGGGGGHGRGVGGGGRRGGW